jgi:RNA polymerase sigma-70 factor (ECF subfamily)
MEIMSRTGPRSGATLALGLGHLVLMSVGSPPRRPSIVAAGDGTQGAPGGPLPERDLLELVRDDPARGAPLFYDRFQRDVNRLVWRLLGADPEHDDLVQQVFLIALRRVSQVRDPDKLTAWVRSVCVSVVHDEIRKRRVRRLFLRDAIPNEVYPNLVHDLEVRDFLLRAKKILDDMPTNERMVFVLHVLEGKDLVDIAELCGHSFATAKRRLARAHRRLEKLVAGDPDLQRLLERMRKVERARPDALQPGADP